MVTWNIVKYPLDHMTFEPAKFKTVVSNSLGVDEFTRNVTDGWMDGQMDRQTGGQS